MATKNATFIDAAGDGSVLLVTWAALLNGDDGSPAELSAYADRTIQLDGTFGAGGSITVQGSNDNSNWFALTDPQGVAITKTAAALKTITEVPRYIRPIVTAGDGTTTLNTRLIVRRATPLRG